MTPSELIFTRIAAFAKGDFGLIYDTYHPESNFKRQFPDRDEYVHLGKTSLSRDYLIMDCRVLDEDITDQEARILLLMQVKVNNQVQRYAELVWFISDHGRWLYHRGQKMTEDELPEKPDTLEFKDFDRLDPATIF